MNIILTQKETTEAISYYLRKKYGMFGTSPSIDISKPRTGDMITTISFESVAGQALTSEVPSESILDVPKAIPEADPEPKDDFPVEPKPDEDAGSVFSA